MSLKEEEQDSCYVYTVYRNMSVDDISKVFKNRGKYRYQNFKEEDDINEAAGLFVFGMWIGFSIIFAIGLFAIIWNWLT